MPPTGNLPLVERAAQFSDRIAVAAFEGSFTYRDLLDASARVAASLLDGAADLNESPVAFLARPGFGYVATQWGIWRAGGIAVPLSPLHPPPEVAYVLDHCGAGAIIGVAEFEPALRPLAEERGARYRLIEEAVTSGPAPLPAIDLNRRAMILYTSGTTSRPKGVVTTHARIEAQLRSLVEAWEWSEQDRILHVLPLHHIHGIINVLTCALWSGAACDILAQFDAAGVWSRFLRGGITLFMAVPTIYERLIAAWEKSPTEEQQVMSAACAGLRLMISGSAALPVATLEKWRAISGHTLLERYGMTEIGMALSNPLHGERVPGHVGMPLPGVEVRLVDDVGEPSQPGVPGEIHVRGPGVFREYWRDPEASCAAFDGSWFRTGDIAVLEDRGYRILGRRSVDIIKTGGYKVSALEVEEALREHPAVRECAVVGSPDPEWGERVAASVVLREGQALTLTALRGWLRDRIAAYKMPTRLMLLPELPRNAMGKVQKPVIARRFEEAGHES